ncbi:MAG: hypothetical protein IJE68_01425 [Clostridia bacterium]|nr:hypothetical protein [Clostridia bacterium]
MKKSLKCLFAFGVLFLMNSAVVNAKSIEPSDIPNNSYVIGNYVFSEETVLTTKHIMLASKTIEGDSLDDMIIYYKTPRGQWIDGLSGETQEVPEDFEIDKIDGERVLEDVKITSKEFDGTSEDNEVVYKLLTDKEIGDGIEIYSSDSIDGDYTLINTTDGYENIRVSVLDNTKKYIKIRAYEGTPEDRAYGMLSEAIEIDQTNMSENTKISNIEFGAVDENIITLTINEEVGDGFIIYSSDTKDGEYKYEYEFDYTSEQFTNGKVNFDLRNTTDGTKKYFKVKAYKDTDSTRVFSALSEAYGILLDDIEITSKEFDGTSADNEVVYKLLTDKKVGDGVEIYSSDTKDGEYTLINTTTGYDFIRVSVLDNAKKYIKIRGYEGTPEDRVGSGFSEVIEIDQTNMSEKAKISNIEFGAVDENIITLTISEEVGDGFTIYSSDTKDGEYKYEYDFEYSSEQFSNGKVNFTLRNEATGTTKYFKIKAFKDNDTTRVFSELSSAYGIILQDIEVTGKTFDGTSADNEVVYKLLTDKEVGDGVEIYSSDSKDGEYTLINTTSGYDFIRVSVLDNTTKYIKIRGYQGSTSEDRVYGGFSTPIEIDQTNISENIEISNIEYGVVDENIITLTINEEVGDGFIIYSSDTIDGEYKYEYDFEYSSEQFSNNKVNFTLRNEATGTTKYFKVKAFKDNDTTRVYSALSSASELSL